MEQTDAEYAQFDQVRRGYDRDQVHERLRFLTSELSAAEQAVRSSQERSAILEDELNHARAQLSARGGQAQQESNSSFGFRVEKILRLAEEEAKEVRDQADNEAADLLATAQGDAEAYRQQVERDLANQRAALAQRQDQLDADREALEKEAESVRASAQSEAETVRSQARSETEQMVDQARAESDRLVATANATARQREQACENELQRLVGLRDDVNSQLRRAKEMLDGLFSELSSTASGAPSSDG